MRHTPDTAPDTADTGPDLLVREMVARQMRTTTSAIYRYITYISLSVLILCSATFAAVQVWALRGYLPHELPAPAAWSLPVALQVLVLAAELILLSSAVTRSIPVQATAGAVMAIGYGAEITAHIWEGGQDLVTITLVVMSTLLALCWTLLALALRAGIADADALVLQQRGPATESAGAPAPVAEPVVESAPEPEPEPEPVPVTEPEPVVELAAAELAGAPAESTPAPAAEPVTEPDFGTQESIPQHWYTPAPADTADTGTDTADTETPLPAPGAQLSDIEMDAVVHMLATETDPPRSYRDMELRYRELGYVGGAARLRESWHRVTQPATT